MKIVVFSAFQQVYIILNDSIRSEDYKIYFQQEWNSTQTVTVTDDDSTSFRLFKGDYDVILLDGNGDEIERHEVSAI